MRQPAARIKRHLLRAGPLEADPSTARRGSDGASSVAARSDGNPAASRCVMCMGRHVDTSRLRWRIRRVVRLRCMPQSIVRPPPVKHKQLISHAYRHPARPAPGDRPAHRGPPCPTPSIPPPAPFGIDFPWPHEGHPGRRTRLQCGVRGIDSAPGHEAPDDGNR